MKTVIAHCMKSSVSHGEVCAMVFLGLMGVSIAMGQGVPMQHEGQAHGHQHGGHAHEGKKLEIVMQDGVYHVLNDRDHQYRLTVNAGEETTIVLRNQDGVAHEFITPLFTRTEVQFSGDAVGIFGKVAAGFRLDPGKTLILRLTVPYSQPFRTMFDVVWCNLHQTADGEAREGELLLVATNEIL
ncbi:MAG: hypothetical protein KC594_17835 [Nitrospira sp.]|nr:hypothetical protein [Nitrospira sp.]